MRAFRLPAFVLALVLASCTFPGPAPEPTAKPEPDPSPVCQPVGATCGCWHRPPGEAWQQLPPCTEPTAPPVAECMVEAEMIGVPCVGEQFGGAVLTATTKLGPLGSSCEANNRALAEELKHATGKCTIGGIEAVFIVPRSDGLIEERHTCFFKDGSWTNSGRGKFMGCHTIKSAPKPPTPPPPTDTACPAPPCPDKTYPDGRVRWKWNAHLYPPDKVDTTPVTKDQEPFCSATGQSPMADGTLRGGCPMRVDLHAERRPVEEWLVVKPTLDSRNGAKCEQVEDNPFQFYRANGNCRLCTPSKDVCTEWF